MTGIRSSLLAVALLAASAAELTLGDHSAPAMQVTIAALFTLPLALRHRHPWLPGCVQAVLLVVLGALGREPEATAEVLALFAGAYTAGALLERRPSVAVLTALAAGSALNTTLLGSPEDIFWSVGVFVVPPWAGGRLMRLRREQEARLEDLNAALERERDLTAQLTAEAERARVAADVRAVLATGLRELTERAERLATAAAAPTPEDFAGLRASGAAVTAELRRLLGLLH